jgi:hypothetical protein
MVSFDPRTTGHFALPRHKLTPYTVVRDKQSLVFNTGVNPLVVLLGMFDQSNSTNTIMPVIGRFGFGSGLINGIGDNMIPTTNVTTLTVGRARLHRYAVSIQCTGTNSAGVTPDGFCLHGVCNSLVDATGFTTYNDVYAWLLQRYELHQTSNYSTMVNPSHHVGVPNDRITYESFSNIGSITTTPLNCKASDAFRPVVVAFSPTVATCSVLVTIHSEWTIMYTSEPVLQATMTTHPSVTEEEFEAAAAAAALAMGQIATRARAFAGALRAPLPPLLRALPAIA